MGRDNRTMEGQWKGIIRTIHNRENNGEGQRTGGTKEWRTMERRQRDERTKDWRDKGLEDNGEWRQKNNGVKGTKDMEQWG